MIIQSFFDSRTNTLTYVVHAEKNPQCVVIDPVLDYEFEQDSVFTESADKLIQYLESNKLQLKYILETHVHADHLTAADFLRVRYPTAMVVIGQHVDKVQKVFNAQLGLTSKTADFDLLVKEGDVLPFSSLKVEVIETPGHTPACVTYKIGDALFTGDFLFMPDSGTGRCDFPLGSAVDLYQSVQKIFALPDSTRIFVGHDYQPLGRVLRFQTTVGEQKASNIHVHAGVSESEYVKFREERDKTLPAPKLLEPSLKVNLKAGKI